jgi:hypothetical protein
MHVSTVTDPRVTEPRRAVTSPTLAVDAIAEASAVSWGAIIAGAFATAALVLLLFLLGTGLGLLSISPWTNFGASATTIGFSAAIWLVIVHVISSGTGGFITGRLRTKWTSAQIDEVFFRDTAHGFLAWAVSVVIGVALLSMIVLSVISGGAQIGSQAVATVGAAATSAAAQAAGQNSTSIADPPGYWVDTLFRSERDAPDANNGATRAEVMRIIASGLGNGDFSSQDKVYLAQVVAARTGLSQIDAEKRVADVIRQAKDARMKAEATIRSAANAAREAGVYLSLWTFIAMLAGAFTSSYAATVGGRIRDE